MSLINPIPNGPFYSSPSYNVNTPQGNLVLGSGLSVTPNGTLLVASALGGTVSQVTAGVGLSGGTITTIGTIDLVAATNASLGGVKVGANLLIAPDGTLSALPSNPGTITGVISGTGLQGGGTTGTVTLSLLPASTSQVGGVSIASGGGLTVTSASLSLASASATQLGGVRLATGAEVIAGTDAVKAITPATLSQKTATLLRPGIVQLSDSVAIADSTKAATQTAAYTANAAAAAAQATANAALAKSGGTMTGVITFAPAQTFPGVAFPVATANSLGVISAGPGLQVNSSGVLSTIVNGTVTAVTAGPGLGCPASGNTISTSGTLRLLPPTTDGVQLGGVKAGANINIAFDGTISVPGANFIASNNPYAYNSYIWPAPQAPGPGPIPLPPCPGANGQVLTMVNQTNGTLGWTSTGTLSGITAGTGLTVTPTPSAQNPTVSLTTVPSITPGNVGGTALIPTLAVNAYGQITSTGLANPFSAFQSPTVTAPFILVLDFAGNNTNWQWTLQGNTTIQNPLNAVSGQTGALLIEQNPLSTYSITWGSSWKFANFMPFPGAMLAEVTLLKFTVVAANYIVVDSIVTNIG
jgi:hypothetical protein